MSNWIVGFGSEDHEYVINGVKYIVGSKFQKSNFKEPAENTLLSSRIEKYLTNDFADLTANISTNKISNEYVCSAAGKEDSCSRRKN